MPQITSNVFTFLSAACIGFPFTIASSFRIRSSSIDNLCASKSREVVNNNTEIWPFQKYQSSNATPPFMQINATGEPLASGLIFIGQENGGSVTAVEQASPFIMTDDNDLIWSGPVANAANFRQQFLYNQSVITYWEGIGGAADAGLVGLGYGQVLIYDNKYQLSQTICLQLNLTQPEGVDTECDADPHESYITPRNSILLTAYNVTQTDATSVGGSADAWVYDPLAVEVDIETGDILFLWSPLAHVPINSTHYAVDGTGVNASQPFDWFHMNSIQRHDGNYLINSRHTWTTYYVSPEGDILWQIDGINGGSFGSLPDNVTFVSFDSRRNSPLYCANYLAKSWEHEARIHSVSSNQSIVTWFANNNEATTTTNITKALGLLLTLPPSPEHPPQVVNDLWDHVNPLSSYSQGSFSQLSNGNYLVGYGAQAFVKEFGPGNSSGSDLRWSAQFAASNQGQSYRAYKQEWHATPAYEPSVVVRNVPLSGDDMSSCAGQSTLRGYVSWNGATDVTSYVVYAGTSNTTLEQLGTVQKMGFETKFSLPADTKAVQVGAVQKTNGAIVRRSEIVYIS